MDFYNIYLAQLILSATVVEINEQNKQANEQTLNVLHEILEELRKEK